MRQLLALLAITLLLPLSASALEQAPSEGRQIEEGRDFTRLSPALPTRAPAGKVEVIEFFWYGCPHCYAAEKHVAEWLENKPEDVIFTRIPATLSRGWALMAKAYYTAEALDVLDVMHPALFSAFHEDSRMLGSEDQLAAYFNEKAGIEEDAFREAFNSMRVASRVQRADVLARRYRVSGVPTMAVNGKFTTDPRQAGGYAEMVDTVDTLARWELRPPAE